MNSIAIAVAVVSGLVIIGLVGFTSWLKRREPDETA